MVYAPASSWDTFRDSYPDFDSPCDDWLYSPLQSVISDFLSTAPSDLDSSVFDLVSLEPVPRETPFSADLTDDNFLSPVLSLAV